MTEKMSLEQKAKTELLERLAELEHEQWSHWIKYDAVHGTQENRAKWISQAHEPYPILTEKEKESDRAWARKVLEVFEPLLVDAQKSFQELQVETKKLFKRNYDIQTHTVTVHDDFIVVRPKSNNHMIIIGGPDNSVEPKKHFETSIHVGNHCTFLINGKHKGTIQLCLQSGEFPTELGFDESEGVFIQKSTYELIHKKGEAEP